MMRRISQDVLKATRSAWTDSPASALGRLMSAAASDDLMEVVASKIPDEQVRRWFLVRGILDSFEVSYSPTPQLTFDRLHLQRVP